MREEKKQGRIAGGEGGGSIMREIEKEEDSAREERRVGGCQPRRRSIFDGKQFPLLKLLQADTAMSASVDTHGLSEFPVSNTV